jgi:hypothetical protein
MVEIRPYRGWTPDGKKVEGCLIKGNKSFICTDYENPKSIPHGGFLLCTVYEVIPSTVGQATGFRDKNKKQFYGGDIVKYDRSKMLAVIEFHCGSFSMRVETPKGTRWYSMMNNYDCVDEDMILDSHEIIGTIHDNPELLK